MNRLIASIALAACLTCFGCADKPVEVDLTKSPGDDVSNDYVDCEAKAYRATGTMTDEQDFEARRAELVDECMKTKGYSINE